jgi:glucan 1,3-beta-glucosidase
VRPWEKLISNSSPQQRRDLLEERSCGGPVTTNPSIFWYEQITHNGISPFINGGNNWKVFRNLKTDFAAKGDGSTDDSTAIQNALNGKPFFIRNCLAIAD